MRIGERISHSGKDTQHLRQRQQTSGRDEVPQVPALDEFQRNIGKAAVFSGLVQRNDVGMIESPGRLGLAEKTRLHLDQFALVKRLRQGHGLDGYRPSVLLITSEIDDTHGALAQCLFDPVRPDAGTRLRSGTDRRRTRRRRGCRHRRRFMLLRHNRRFARPAEKALAGQQEIPEHDQNH